MREVMVTKLRLKPTRETREVGSGESSLLAMYSRQCARSRTSPAENFQFLEGVSSRSRNRFFCSAFDTCRKNFSTATPLRRRCRSKPVMSSKRSSQIRLDMAASGSRYAPRISG